MPLIAKEIDYLILTKNGQVQRIMFFVYLLVFIKTMRAPQLTKNLIMVLIKMNKLTLANLVLQTSAPARDNSQ